MTVPEGGSSPVLLLFGPTAVGKTALLRRLFAGEGAIPAEIINADSMQVYSGMDVGTAKATSVERRILPHHLIDVRDPSDSFSVGEFTAEADRLVPDILGRGCLPVLSGGTAFYLRTYLFGLPEAPPADADVRDRVRRMLETDGAAALHRHLAEVDVEAAERIHPNDQYRVTRALEVWYSSGKPLSSFDEGAVLRRGIEPLIIGLARDRQELYARIDARVEAMFASGLPAEVAGLRAAGYGPGNPGMQAIGYKEFFLHDDPAVALREIQKNSRRYAKRQITFFKRIPGVRWFHPEADADAVADVVGEFRKNSA